MKRIYFVSLIVLLIFSDFIYSQSYRSVSSSNHYSTSEEGKFNNIYIFEFSPSAYDYYEYKKCKITLFALDSEGDILPLDNHIVRAITGYDQNYIEYEGVTNSSGYIEIYISTNDIQKLTIGVCFNGYDREIYLRDVQFFYYDKKY